ncbi:UNVERIFIED_CONTAM: hypothetical protein FKN15_058891 [Acipenser sinensis]
MSTARSLAEHWTELGLTDVHLVNYTVLLSLPGSTPNTITAKDRGQCILPNGTPYDTESHTPYHIDQLYSYVAYSAKGVREAEVIDVQYGTLDDLIQAHTATNVANKIALLKLGHVPLLYKAEVIDVQYGTLDDLIQAHTATNVANKIALLKLGHVPLLYKAEVIDVQYGTLDDLIQAHTATNVANKIALLKLGHVPLLYKNLRQRKCTFVILKFYPEPPFLSDGT